MIYQLIIEEKESIGYIPPPLPAFTILFQMDILESEGSGNWPLILVELQKNFGQYLKIVPPNVCISLLWRALDLPHLDLFLLKKSSPATRPRKSGASRLKFHRFAAYASCTPGHNTNG